MAHQGLHRREDAFANNVHFWHHTSHRNSVLGAWFCGPRDSWLVLHLKVEGGILRLLPPAPWPHLSWRQHVAKITFHPGIVRYLWGTTRSRLASKCGTSASSVGAKSTTSGTQPCSLYAFSTVVFNIGAILIKSRSLLAIDIKCEEDNNWYVYLNGGRTKTNKLVTDWAKEAVDLGVGEILKSLEPSRQIHIAQYKSHCHLPKLPSFVES